MEISEKILARRAKWRRYYYHKRQFHLERAKAQYYREKETNYETLRLRNQKAKHRQRFGEEREKILQRFGNKCADCGRTINLIIHHIDHQGRNVQNLGYKPNNEPTNLKVLCKRCHTLVHNKMKTKSDTPSNGS